VLSDYVGAASSALGVADGTSSETALAAALAAATPV
jgi:hypothetical protein